jgi:prolyl-tRNA synthetase
MHQTSMLIPTLRSVSEAEMVSDQLLLRGGYIRQLAAGIYTFLPLAYRVLHKIEKIVREELDRIGAQQLLLPVLHPAGLWKESGSYTDYEPELVTLRDRHERGFVVGPTHEEVIMDLLRDEINTYKKLPMILYQIQTKFRDERRPRSGLLGGQEFLAKDAYSFHADRESLDHTYEEMVKVYINIFTRCGLDFRAVEADEDADAIGDKGMHKFMVLSGAREDMITLCKDCSYAANIEMAKVVAWQKGIEVGRVCKLGTKYSEAMNAKFLDSQGKEQPFIMGCYGIEISRILAAIVEQHHDKDGIIWPKKVAPFHVHMIVINPKDEDQAAMMERTYAAFQEDGVEVLLDDRLERPEVKFKDADLLGIPLQLIVGDRAHEYVREIKYRHSGERKVLVGSEEMFEAVYGFVPS